MEIEIKELSIGIIGIILIASIIIAPFYGWVNNFVQFTQLDFERPYKAEIIRGVGIVTVVPGVILGFIEIEDN